MSGGGVKLAAAVGIALVISTGMKQHHHGGIIASLTSAGTSNLGGGQAVSYARAQVGKPYCWGGTGPSCYDCSGLVMKAYQSAGVSIPRTSQGQWAALPHVSSPQPGDLVFFPGSDGTASAPGHVALVISGGRMIQAYGRGVPLEVSPLNGNGAGGIVGYARPGGA